MSTIGERFSILIKELNCTQTAMAKKVGVSPAMISSVCKGTTNPSDRTIKDVCREYHVDLDWLKHGIPPKDGRIISQTKEEAISDFLGDVMARDDPTDFRKRLVSALAAMDEDEWDLLEKLLDRIAPEKENPGR